MKRPNKLRELKKEAQAWLNRETTLAQARKDIPHLEWLKTLQAKLDGKYAE
jgi:hypothetical protein